MFEHLALLNASVSTQPCASILQPCALPPPLPPPLTPAEPNTQQSKAFKGFKFNSVGSQFKRQLGELMGQLQVGGAYCPPAVPFVLPAAVWQK